VVGARDAEAAPVWDLFSLVETISRPRAKGKDWAARDGTLGPLPAPEPLRHASNAFPVCLVAIWSCVRF
jgi:hypothetical protein